MASEFVINQVKKLIVGGLGKYASEIKGSLNKIGLVFYTEDKSGTPLIQLMHEGKIVRSSSFEEMAKKVSIPFVFSPFFNLEKDLPIWIQKILVKCAIDKSVDILKATYVMRMQEDDDLHAYMYVDWKCFPSSDKCEIEIDYILSTE